MDARRSVGEPRAGLMEGGRRRRHIALLTRHSRKTKKQKCRPPPPPRSAGPRVFPTFVVQLSSFGPALLSCLGSQTFGRRAAVTAAAVAVRRHHACCPCYLSVQCGRIENVRRGVRDFGFECITRNKSALVRRRADVHHTAPP